MHASQMLTEGAKSWLASPMNRHITKVTTWYMIEMRLQVTRTYTTACINTLLGRFSMIDIPTAGIMPVPKRSVMDTSRRELSEDVRIVRY